MGLLVVQVLNAVLNLAQKHIGRAQGLCRGVGHEPSFGHALQSIQSGAGAQLGELPATHHLQQLHCELDLPNPAARELDVVGAFRVPSAALGRMLANLMVQCAQGLKNVVIQVASKHKGQHHPTQSLGRPVNDGTARGHHPAFHPGKAFPFAALHLQVLL